MYHNYFLYHKDQKSFSDRRKFTEWRNEIHSKSAYLDNGKLILSQSDYLHGIMNCDLVILNDFNTETELEAIELQNKRWNKDLIEFEQKTHGQVWGNLKQVQYMNLLGSQRKFQIFQLKLKDGTIELHLLYDLYEIGEPRRDNFKICNLDRNVPIEVKINGKLDHSMTSGRERSYKEHSYIFHLLGQVDEFQLRREPFEGILKQIPKPEKVIDLTKPLY